jgi:tetratricopeptide (TPR) repeat protein
METESSIENLKKEAYVYLKEGDAEKSLETLQNALRIDFDEEELLWTLKCLNWWLEKIKCLEGIGAPYDRGFFIMSQWKGFYGFLDKIGGDFDNSRYAIRHFVSSLALESFLQTISDGPARHDPPLDMQIGRCYKGIGDYERALEYVKKAAQFMRESGEVLAELADIYALIGEEEKAKGWFREAFFLNPEAIDVHSMESSLITKLARTVRALGVPPQVLGEWIPVYGELLGVFSVKRPLLLVELGKLKQAVFTLENDVRNNEEQTNLIPRLLNKYLWLLDHYESANEKSAFVNEVLLKIKLIDPSIYERYMSVK